MTGWWGWGVGGGEGKLQQDPCIAMLIIADETISRILALPGKTILGTILKLNN
jgi:hypothetical protein